jgi:hypothetical protein
MALTLNILASIVHQLGAVDNVACVRNNVRRNIHTDSRINFSKKNSNNWSTIFKSKESFVNYSSLKQCEVYNNRAIVRIEKIFVNWKQKWFCEFFSGLKVKRKAFRSLSEFNRSWWAIIQDENVNVKKIKTFLSRIRERPENYLISLNQIAKILLLQY